MIYYISSQFLPLLLLLVVLLFFNLLCCLSIAFFKLRFSALIFFTFMSLEIKSKRTGWPGQSKEELLIFLNVAALSSLFIIHGNEKYAQKPVPRQHGKEGLNGVVALTVEGQSFPTLTADGLFLDVLTIDVLSLVNFQNISDISRLEDYKGCF